MEEPEHQYYYADEDKVPQGPFIRSDLESMLTQGRIARDTLVIQKGDEKWIPLGDLLGRDWTPNPPNASGSEDPKPSSGFKSGGWTRFILIEPVLRNISQGRLISIVSAVVTYVVAIVGATIAVIVWFGLWKLITDASEVGGVGVVLGGILFQAVLLIGIFMIAQIMWIRASDMGNQPASDFTVIPLFSIFLRMAGEVSACSSVVAGVGGCLLICFAGTDGGFLFGGSMPSYFNPPLGADLNDGTFLSALLFLLGNVIWAFVTLVIFYLLAEAVLVFVDMARNIRLLRDRISGCEAVPGEGADVSLGTETQPIRMP